MKRILLFISIIFICTNLFAQDWQLFNTDFKTYYLQKEFFNRVWAEYDKVFEVQFRKEKLAENHYVFLSSRMDSIHNSDSCLYKIRKSQKFLMSGDNELMIDRYEIRNDTLIYYLENYGIILDSSKFIYFPLKLNPGDSLLINNIKIKFVEKKFSEIIQGVSDSVLVFNIWLKDDVNKKTVGMYLSKNYGLLSFISLKNIIADERISTSNINVIGTENIVSKEHYGYIPKKMKFSDLIKFKAGDTRYWSFGNYDLTWGEHRYYKDTIISVVEESDSLKLLFQRISYYNNKLSSFEEMVESYNIKDWVRLLSDRQNNINKVYYNYLLQFTHRKDKTSLILPSGYVINNEPYIDSLFDFSFNPICLEDFGTTVSPDCTLNPRTDYHSHVFYAPNVGMYFSYIFGTSNEIISELIAYTIEGRLYGKIPDKFYSINENDEELFSISPNPATDYINIDMSFLRMQESEIKIYDILGNEMHPPRQTSSDTPQEGNLHINISTMPPGVYFVQIGNEKPLKFVKI